MRGRGYRRRMPVRRSIAVILSAGGAELDPRTLSDLPCARIVRVEFAWGGRSACVAATVEHDVSPAVLLARLGPWAARRGWSVTIAPLPNTR